jgi:hypothetical protein
MTRPRGPTAATMTRTCAVTSCVQQAIAYSLQPTSKRSDLFAATDRDGLARSVLNRGNLPCTAQYSTAKRDQVHLWRHGSGYM